MEYKHVGLIVNLLVNSFFFEFLYLSLDYRTHFHLTWWYLFQRHVATLMDLPHAASHNGRLGFMYSPSSAIYETIFQPSLKPFFINMWNHLSAIYEIIFYPSVKSYFSHLWNHISAICETIFQTGRSSGRTLRRLLTKSRFNRVMRLSSSVTSSTLTMKR